MGKLTPSGVATGYRLPANSNPGGIVEGADGNLWFTEESANKIGRITTKGKIAEFSVPTGGSKPEYIAKSSGGNLYFSEAAANKLGRITPNGTITETPLPEGARGPEGIADPGMGGTPWIVTVLHDSNGVFGLPLDEPFSLFNPHKVATEHFKEFLDELEEDAARELADVSPFSSPKGLDAGDEAEITRDLEEFERFEAKGVNTIRVMADTEQAADAAFFSLESLQAADPPRYDFQRFARASASSPRLPASLTRGVRHAVVAAADAVLANAASFRSFAAALLATFERLQGAFGAGNGEAEASQARHGVSLAEKEAALIAAAPKLDKRLATAVGKSLRVRHISRAALRRLARARHTGFAPAITALMRKLGLTATQIKAVGKHVGKPRGSLTLPEFADQKRQYKLDAATAAKAKAFASFLREIAAG